MATKTAEKKTASPKEQAAPEEEMEETDRAGAVKKILLNVEKKMKGKDLKATLGDYIRLIQLAKEMGEEPKSEIKVTWIEEPELTPEK